MPSFAARRRAVTTAVGECLRSALSRSESSRRVGRARAAPCEPATCAARRMLSSNGARLARRRGLDLRAGLCDHRPMISLGALPVAASRSGVVSAPAAAALRSYAASSSAVKARPVAAAVLARSYPQALGRPAAASSPARPPMSRPAREARWWRTASGGAEVSGPSPALPPVPLLVASSAAPAASSPADAFGGGGGGGSSAAQSLPPLEERAAPAGGERGTIGASVTLPDWTILAGVAAVVGVGYLLLRKRGHV